ncbi:acyltransferase family protein [Corynebacterium mendelii]|uniref:Acyltransferase n=1 Tax=Corynebacterium mendelii TaxID=2765362 RepID=A0A939E4G6_9CORY|nr:acyltransferase [Corynebacterium mendelii]MBN9645227.1 acyltransferase [Corynebacterium mendelii]
MTVPAACHAPRFNPALEGLRAVAALGVMTTHVAFQTGVSPSGHIGGILSRLDFFVPVFFTLSAFVLWRRHGTVAGLRRTRWGVYAIRRIFRIVPAYLVVVGLVLVAHPPAFGVPADVAAATVLMVQIYLPHGLAPGLTHLWSLSVEVAFYALLPVLAVVLSPVKKTRARLVLLVAVAVVSYGWAWIPAVAASPADGIANRQIYPPAFASWFAVGMIAAEIEPRAETFAAYLIRWRWVCWLAAAGVLWVASRPWFGPVGLVHPDAPEFARRVAAGTVFSALVVVPVALAPRQGMLSGPVGQMLGRYSYGIFLIHLPVLEQVMVVMGIPVFSGHTGVVWIVTAVVTVLAAAALYVLVEHPARVLSVRLVGSSTQAMATRAAATTNGRSPA